MQRAPIELLLPTAKQICPERLNWPSMLAGKVEIFLEQREVAFLSPSKICEHLNFSTEIQIFANFAG
jgi:hypothetical protein